MARFYWGFLSRLGFLGPGLSPKKSPAIFLNQARTNLNQTQMSFKNSGF
jgi:hypothetical protein